jgi:CRP-like cAMP-binding protein
MSSQPRRATVRAIEATEVLSLSQTAFNDIVMRSVGGLENIQAAVKLYSASG